MSLLARALRAPGIDARIEACIAAGGFEPLAVYDRPTLRKWARAKVARHEEEIPPELRPFVGAMVDWIYAEMMLKRKAG